MSRNLSTLAASILLLSGVNALAQTSTWKLDTNHTQVDFQIRRVPVSTVRGSFGKITGTVNWDREGPVEVQRGGRDPYGFHLDQ